MKLRPLVRTGHRKWEQNIILMYWMVVSVYLAIDIIGIVLDCLSKDKLREFGPLLLRRELPPLISLAVCLLGITLLQRLPDKWREYSLIASGAVLAGIMVSYHPAVEGIQFLFTMPLLISVMTFQRGKVALSFFCNLVAFLLLVFFHPTFSDHISHDDVFLMTGVLLCGFIVSHNILNRGIELQQHLIETIESQQDLLIQNAMMDKLSKTDALTDLYNHKTFHEYLDKLIEHAEHNSLSLQLAILDIDNFKKINDTYGHWIGDIILRRVSAAVREHISPNDFAARYGGEEFSVIFTEKTLQQAYRTIEHIRMIIAKTPHEELNGQAITISGGLQPYRRGDGKESLFKGADAALYKAKHSGKNKTVAIDLTETAV